MTPALVSIEGLQKNFRTRQGVLKAVNDVSFQIKLGETLAIVGESGCGKTTLALALLGLVVPDAGTIAINGDDLRPISGILEKRLIRDIGVVFQSPHSSLNPRMKVRAIVSEPLIAASGIRGKALSDSVAGLLSEVGLGPEHMNRYPHELSGGQLQRVAIARALALKPSLLILDEPTAALDVSVQAQVLKLLKAVQADCGASYLFITHDLGAVDYIADRVIVMYLGQVVESGPVADVFVDPKHPYTRALLDAVPTLDPEKRRCIASLQGEVPSLLNRPNGCAFAPRCYWSSDQCHRSEPLLQEVKRGRDVACHHPLSSRS